MAAKKKEDFLTIEDKLKAALVPESEQPYPTPEKWIWTRLGVISLDPQYGWTTSAASEGDVRLLRTTDITAGQIDWSSVPYCKETPADLKKYLVRDGDIVISRAGSVGFSHLIKNPEKAVFASYLIRFKPLIVQAYLAHFLKSQTYWDAISESSSGIAIPNVNASKLKQISIPVAPLPEQQRIAEKLESLLGKIKEAKALLDEVPEILQNFRQTVLAAAYSGRLTEDWRTENQDIVAAKKISKENESDSVSNDTPLYQIPNSWAWKKMGNICTIITGKTPPTADPKYTESDDLPFITPAAFNMGDRLSYSERYVSNAAVKVAPLIPAKSVLLTSIGATLGKVAFLEVAAVVNQQINALIPRDIEAVYIFRWTCSQSFQETMWAKSSATTLPIINKSRCEQLPIPVPPLPEQQEIGRLVESLFSKAEDFEAQYKEAMELIDSLPEIILSKAFRGELVPQDPNDEPAIKLLERICAESIAVPKQTDTLFKIPEANLKELNQQRSKAMSKRRNDSDVKGKPFLTEKLRDMGGVATAQKLYDTADLPIVDFYKQLSDEFDQGWLRKIGDLVEAA